MINYLRLLFVLVVASATDRRLGEPQDPLVQPIQHRDLQQRADVVGNNGRPRDRFPLGRCEGDCT